MCNFSLITLLHFVMTQLCRPVAVMVANCINTAELIQQALGPLNSDQNVLILLNEVCALTASVTYKIYEKINLFEVSMVMQQYSLFICHFGLSFSASFTPCLLTVFTWIVFECLNFSLFAILSSDTHIWMVASFRAAFLH